MVFKTASIAYNYTYCTKWGLHVNLSKTKIIIFNKAGRLSDHFNFYYNHQNVEISRTYCYLGIVFNCSGNFNNAVDRLTEQARKALFKLQQKNVQNHIGLTLFETLIVPILRYCFEVWGPFYGKNLNADNIFQICEKLPIEKIHTKFCRFLLGVHRKATNAAVRAELGCHPLFINFCDHSAKYWLSLCNSTSSSDTLVKKAYFDSYTSTTNSGSKSSNWANLIKNLWSICKLEGVWDNQGSKYRHKTIRLLNNSLTDMYNKAWVNHINCPDSKLRTYKTFKLTTFLENYLLQITNIKTRKEFTKLRISSHRLQIEMGRYSRPKTPLENRTCKLCNSSDVEDEKHFLLFCPFYQNERALLYNELKAFTIFDQLSREDKFLFIINYNKGDVEVLKHVLNFVNVCVEKRNTV